MALKGRLNTLAKKFSEVGGDLDNIESVLSSLEELKWNHNLASMRLLVGTGGSELNMAQSLFIERLIEKKSESLPEPKLNDWQKMDALVKYYERGDKTEVDIDKLKLTIEEMELKELAL